MYVTSSDTTGNILPALFVILHGAYFMPVNVLQLLAVCKCNDTNIKVITVGSHPDPVKIVCCLVALPQPFSFQFDASHALFVSIVLHCSLCVISEHRNELKHLIFYLFFHFILFVEYLPLPFVYSSLGFSAVYF